MLVNTASIHSAFWFIWRKIWRRICRTIFVRYCHKKAKRHITFCRKWLQRVMCFLVLPYVVIMHCCQSAKCVFVKKHLTFFIKRAIIIMLCLKMISTFSDSFRKWIFCRCGGIGRHKGLWCLYAWTVRLRSVRRECPQRNLWCRSRLKRRRHKQNAVLTRKSECRDLTPTT